MSVIVIIKFRLHKFFRIDSKITDVVVTVHVTEPSLVNESWAATGLKPVGHLVTVVLG
jgi:hypothetical protein